MYVHVDMDSLSVRTDHLRCVVNVNEKVEACEVCEESLCV